MIQRYRQSIFQNFAVPFEGNEVDSDGEVGEMEAVISETAPASDVESAKNNPDGSSIDASKASSENTIYLDENFIDKYFRTNQKVEIPFVLYCNGQTNQNYFVEIYNSSEQLVARHSGAFPNESGAANLSLTWDAGGCAEDTYFVRFYATFRNDWDNYIFPFHLTNNDGKSYNGNQFKIDDDNVLRCYDSSGNRIVNSFLFDGDYTYYLMSDGSPMTEKLTYHPDGVHLIYFDAKGHELFDKFQYCDDVKYVCYFDSSGYIYKDQITFINGNAYYLDGDGRAQQSGWFRFANGRDYGFANSNGTLYTNGFSYDPWGRVVFYHWNGMVARGLITDGMWYYHMDETDGHLLGMFM